MTSSSDSVPFVVPSGAKCAVHGDRPAEFGCSRCGSFACGECRHLGAGAAVFCAACKEHAFGDIPFERRDEMGIVRAVGLTVFGVVIKPWEFFAQRSREASIWPALAFGVLVNLPSSMAFAVVNALTIEQQRALLLENPAFRGNPLFNDGEVRDMMELFYSPGYHLTAGVCGLFLYPLVILITAAVQWVALFAVGARAAPFREVFRAYCYLQATNLVLVPIAPIYLAFMFLSPQVASMMLLPFTLYTIVWGIIAMWKVERTELWRPVAAQGLLWTTCCCTIGGVAVAIGVLVGAALQQALGGM